MNLFRLTLTILLGLLLPTLVPAQQSATSMILESCPYPDNPPPQIPNGRKATEEEMLSAQAGMKAYKETAEAYLACLSELEASWGEQATEEQTAVIHVWYDKLLAELESVAGMFNSAVRAFRGR